MKSNQNRRLFLKSSAIAVAGIGLGVQGFAENVYPKSIGNLDEGTRVGIIGLDTSHSIAFTKALNNPAAGPEFSGFKVLGHPGLFAYHYYFIDISICIVSYNTL